MSSIESLGISGIRGYTPQNYQRIEFMKPLTLIWGKNGSGKTTIIECLKYITTGALPPNSDKGKSFIMDTKVAGKPEVIGDIRLIFKTGNRAILAKRRMMLSAKGSSTKFQSIQQVLKTKGEKGQQLTINHQCAQIQKQVPQFLGISKPILENIVFCHQDESLWPFGDSTLLKNIFDQLFQTKKITKQMERMWDIHKEQQNQLKQLKIRLEYQKQTHKKQLQERSKMFLQLQEIKLRGKQMLLVKQRILKMKEELHDSSGKSRERQKLIFRKGRLDNSIASLQAKIRGWKQSLLRVEKQFELRIQGRQSSGVMEEESFGVSRGQNMGTMQQKGFSTFEIEKVQMIQIESGQKGMQQLEQKRQFYKQLFEKYTFVKQQCENMRAFKQTTKREQQIKSQLQRVKNLLPELKYNREIRSDEQFLRVFKQKLVEMGEKIEGREINRRKFQKLQVPSFVEMGFNEEQIEQLKRESKQLQAEIQSSSVTILKVYKAQYKPQPQNSSFLQCNLQQGQSLEQQLQTVSAILESKQQQLHHYEKVSASITHIDRATLQRNIHHYRIAGIELQQEMLHFCEEKKKCYFCSRKMNEREIEAAKDKVEMVKNKAEEKLRQLEAKRGQQDGGVDAEVMVKKLSQQTKKLLQRKQVLKMQVTKFQQMKKAQAQISLNNTLKKQLQKCNLTIEMLSRLGHIQQADARPQSFYVNVSLQEMRQMCSLYQVKLARYRGVKQQTNKFEENKQRNELIRNRREEIIREKEKLKQAVDRAGEQTRNYDFLKNSCQKLQSLIRMDVKSKNKKGSGHNKMVQGKGGDHNKLGEGQSSSQPSSYSSMEQAQGSMKQLYHKILEEKLYIQRLQISIGHWNDRLLMEEERQQVVELNGELGRLASELTVCEQAQASYNRMFLEYSRESERCRHRLSLVLAAIAEPLQSSYLMTLNKMRHLQASILNIEQCYHLLEQSVSQYHAQKMQEINRYIYEVWREIYHGEDIEYIEIEAMVDAGSKKKKKNYQYRILMKKSTKNFGSKQEMVDMKGRCSTGQKVLASIVIRLALAEVFCSSTRILALDEPTTNLDREHIHNLAQALLRLIELSGGKNLQLIIISHDIDFIQLLEQYGDSYYEVKRDQNRFSTIEKKMIRDILHSK